MSTFTQPSYPTRHAGVARMESTTNLVQGTGHGFDSTRGLSAMLLAAMVSAMVVVAGQLMDAWVDGHLMVVWVGLWLVGFVTLALFASAARRVAKSLLDTLNNWSQQVAQTRSDRRFWQIAQSDPRVMADLDAAMAHNTH